MGKTKARIDYIRIVNKAHIEQVDMEMNAVWSSFTLHIHLPGKEASDSIKLFKYAQKSGHRLQTSKTVIE